MTTARVSSRGRAIVLASLLATFALAVARFGQSLWIDEASSVWFSRLPLARLLMAVCDPHPPGYYLLLKVWQAAGVNEAWLRIPSVFAAVLAIPLTYQFASRLTMGQQSNPTSLSAAVARPGEEEFTLPSAVLAALLLALQPLQSWYASEARMYALAQFLGLMAVWLGLRLLAIPTGQKVIWRDLLAYWFAATLALLADYSALLPWGLLQLVWLSHGRPHARQWLSLQAGILLPVVTLLATSGRLQGLGQTYHPVFLSIWATRLGLDLTPLAAKLLMQYGIVGVVLFLLALAVCWRRLRRPLDRPLVRVLVLGAWLALLVLGAVPRAFTLKRYLVVVLPYMALVTAYALCRSRRTMQGVIVGLGLFATLASVATYQREPWRTVIADLVRADDGTPKVMWVDEAAVPGFDYYVGQDQVVAAKLKWAPLFSRDLPRLPDLTPEPGDALWFVTAENRYRRPVALLPAAFHEQYELAGERHEIGIGAYLFRRRLQPVPGAPAAFIRTQVDEWGILLPSPLGHCDRK